jgi:hypothetical protein
VEAIMGNVRDWARLGASRRIAEISAELAEIQKAFPELGRRERGGAPAVTATATRRGRRSMSTAEKAEVSRRMKAYWARRRKAKVSARR